MLASVLSIEVTSTWCIMYCTDGIDSFSQDNFILASINQLPKNSCYSQYLGEYRNRTQHLFTSPRKNSHATQPGQLPYNHSCSSHIDTSTQPVQLPHACTRLLCTCYCQTLIWWYKTSPYAHNQSCSFQTDREASSQPRQLPYTFWLCNRTGDRLTSLH